MQGEKDMTPGAMHRGSMFSHAALMVIMVITKIMAPASVSLWRLCAC